MKALVCVNENYDVLSVKLSANPNALNKKMREEFESELASLKDEGYDTDDVTSDFCEGDCALIQVSDNYAYYWQIISCDEL